MRSTRHRLLMHARPWPLPQAWWLKVLLAMAVVGVVLLDVYLLEAVLDRVRARDPGLQPNGDAQPPADAGGPLAPKGAAASLLAAARGGGGGGRLLVLKELAHSALAIVPRGASDPDAQAAVVGDDAPSGSATAAEAAARAGAGLPGLETGSGSRHKRHGGGGGGGGAATLRLLNGLLPGRLDQYAQQQRREWQKLRQRHGGLGRDASTQVQGDERQTVERPIGVCGREAAYSTADGAGSAVAEGRPSCHNTRLTAPHFVH
jgi:hypothetical protein